METQRRAAVALIAFVAVAGALVLGVYAVGGQRQPLEEIGSLTAAEQAFEAAEQAMAAVSGPGVDLIEDDPRRALELLTTAYEELDRAENAGYPIAQILPLRSEALEGLDRLYGVTKIRSAELFAFPAEENVELTALVRGYDGAPYVLDRANKTVWRIDLSKKQAKALLRAGQRIKGIKVDDPKHLTVGGPDVLALDAKNTLWRWRPVPSRPGKGTAARIPTKGSSSWGDDIIDVATFVSNFDAAFYKLYLVDPSEQNIMVLEPRNDGSGYSDRPLGRLPTDRPVDEITDLMIDGDIYVAEDGAVGRVIPAAGWKPELPGDTALRPQSNYTMVGAPLQANGLPAKGIGTLYAFDAANRRLVAFDKKSGGYLGQYQLAGDDQAWSGLRGFEVLPRVDPEAPATLWWISSTGLHSAALEAAPDGAAASPAPSTSPTPSAEPTKKPTKTPKS